MTLKEYIENLNMFVEENPETLEMQVLTSVDDEGNGYNLVYFKPSKGLYDDKEFISFESFDEWDIEKDSVNAVCVN